MTDEQRKRLTAEVLGEPLYVGMLGAPYAHRTFTTDADMMALFRKMVDKGEWFMHGNKYDDSFCVYSYVIYGLQHADDPSEYTAWLFYEPERFCCLVAEWLEVKK